MQKTGRQIDRYPQLAAWYDANGQNAGSDFLTASSRFLLTVVDAMFGENETPVSRDAILLLVQGIDLFIRDSSNPIQDFLEADQILARDGLALTAAISQISERGSFIGLGSTLQGSISRLADAVHLAAIRFLSGWLALNNSDYRLCLEECEKIGEPFASVHTLLGQASLELGDVGDAIDSLNVATSLDGKEPMSWFLLAKAHHVIGEQSKSWDALDRAEELTGADAEIRSMRAFVALAEPRIDRYLDAAWASLKEFVAEDAIHPSLAVLMLELSFARSDLTGTQEVINKLEAAEAATSPDFKSNLPRTLRRLQEFGRMDLASTLLDRILVASGAPESPTRTCESA